ncbi:MAG: ABC transporter permease [Pseudomonadota bacterium]
MKILSLAWASLLNRKFTVFLTVIAIALSVALLVGVERIRSGAQAGFNNTISGTDLIIGARTGQLQLLLYSVFRMGNATNNITWESYQDISKDPAVEWSVPMSLGDSHRGYAVLGTSADYFERFRYGRKQPLTMAQGKVYDDLFDAVIGSEVAAKLGYQTGSEIVVAHGTGATSFAEHKDKPFVVSGILARTGTPVDRTVHVSLEAIEAIHIGWESGSFSSSGQVTADEARQLELQPKAITAFMVGVKSKLGIFKLQRAVNQYREEPLMAILPGVALQELWRMLGVVEKALFAISLCVVVTGLIGMLSVILASLNERRREMAILRSCGARPIHVFTLLIGEAFIVTLAGIALGLALLFSVLAMVRPMVEERFGLFLSVAPPDLKELGLLFAILMAALLVAVIPALMAYRHSLADGLTLRV